MERIQLMNICIDNVSMEEVIAEVDFIINNNLKKYVVTPNVDHIVKLEKNEEFKKAYDEAGMVLVDGTPLMWISKWYRTPLKEKITGPRLTETLIELAATRGYTVFFLGAAEGVAKKAEELMKIKYKSLNTVGSYSPQYGFENDKEEINKIVTLINEAKPDLLIAGMGSPKTEIFLNKHIHNMNIHIALSVGAAIDFMAGNVSRCPSWINKIGFEWLYRFFKEPKRMFKRYFIDDIKICKIALKYKINRRNDL
ncbi:MAG: WecB/TagA/CpsF family glycosyltransferase [Lachnospiraceae bacterium]|nr:WecB/TagA/CpsF family glycosyltransferase [Lachnospiraceae bacterium]